MFSVMESSQGRSKAKEKRKMLESNIEEKKDDTRSYISWNLEMEHVLADVLRDQRNLGNKGDGAWKAVAYNTAAQVLSTHFKVPQLLGENVKNQIKLWRTWYGIVSDILSQSGFDWDGSKYIITVENEDVWNEYVKSYAEAKNFGFKVIPNWDDIVDLCDKDKATRVGAETALNAHGAMNNEDDEANSINIGLEESSVATKKRGQFSTSTRTQSQKRRSGEKDGIVAAMRESAESMKEFMQENTKKTDEKDVQEVLDELEKIPGLDNAQWLKAVNWLTENPSKLVVIRALPLDKKKDYLLAFIS